MTKLCKDCTHYLSYENWSGLDSCEHPFLPKKVDNIRGQPLPHYCSEVRGSQGKCGPDGLLFEPHEDLIDEDEPDRYEWPNDEKLDDPRRGQAASINRERS